jgi:hypothetical protein
MLEYIYTLLLFWTKCLLQSRDARKSLPLFVQRVAPRYPRKEFVHAKARL